MLVLDVMTMGYDKHSFHTYDKLKWIIWELYFFSFIFHILDLIVLIYMAYSLANVQTAAVLFFIKCGSTCDLFFIHINFVDEYL